MSALSGVVHYEPSELVLTAMAGTPLVVDYLHHALVPDGLSEAEALAAAVATWQSAPPTRQCSTSLTQTTMELP